MHIPCVPNVRHKLDIVEHQRRPGAIGREREEVLVTGIDDYAVSRGKLLRYGAGGAAAVALGALPGVSAAATGAQRATPKKGGTLKFARSIAPTQLDPSNSIIAGDVYTLDKIFEPLLDLVGHRQADALARQELHDQQGQQDVHVPPAPGCQVLRRQAAHGR